jgi:carboxypeptidase Taq
VVELVKEMAELYGYEDEKYDPLLDKFEHGMKTAEVRAIFDAVKAELFPCARQLPNAAPR